MDELGTPYLMSEWEADLDQLLKRWPLTGRFEDLSAEIDLLLQERVPDSPHAERLARCLVVAIRFLWKNQHDSRLANFFVVGSSGSILKPALAGALFRRIMETPDGRLAEPIDVGEIIELMKYDHR